MADIREPYVSGTFYPRNPDVLKADIEGFLGKATPPDVAGDIRGLISPHAAYMYSGQTAAYGYKAISGLRYDTVVILAPSHRSFFLGAAVQEKGAYRTPFGLAEIDGELARELLKNTELFHVDDNLHRGEHAIEVQLPFLQSVLKDFKIVPLIMGSAQDPVSSLEIADSLHDAIVKRGGTTLIVGSTDLSHYYPYDHAVYMDRSAIGFIERFDVKGLSDGFAKGNFEACGAGAILATMGVCEKLGATKATMLDYKNSGDVSGEMAGVVGYVSCVFYGGK